MQDLLFVVGNAGFDALLHNLAILDELVTAAPAVLGSFNPVGLAILETLEPLDLFTSILSLWLEVNDSDGVQLPSEKFDTESITSLVGLDVGMLESTSLIFN